jgi:hypothetical protein
MNELAVNLAAKRVDHGYLQFLVVSQAAVAHVLRKLFASALPANSMPTRSRIGTPSFISKKNFCISPRRLQLAL